MGEPLVIITSIFQANEILKVIKDPDQLYWEWGPHQLNAAARWLPKKDFKILPKIFDAHYRPGSVGDEGDGIITKAQVCTLEEIMDKDVHILMWNGHVLKLPEMNEELKRGAEGGVLDMSFEEEVIKDIERSRGKGKGDYINDSYLYPDNEALERLCKILTILSDCMDEVKRTKGFLPSFQFFISSSERI